MDQADKTRATRERVIERMANSKLAPTLPARFDSAVVGVSFTPHYPENLHALEEMWFAAEMTDEKLAVVIIRNPANEYDSNACEVHVPALGEMAMVGHLPKAMAARLAPELDNDVVWQGFVSFLRIHPDHEDRPGLEISLERHTDD